MKQIVYDPASKEVLKRGWNAIQNIWIQYQASNKSDEFDVPIATLATNGETIYTIKNLLAGLEKDKCFKWYKGTRNYRFQNIDHQRLTEVYIQLKTDFQALNGVYRCGKLVLDITESSLKYKNNPPVKGISPQNQEVQFLVYLIQNENKIVKYLSIARELNLNSSGPGATNQSVARNVQFVRRNLGYLLENAGMTKDAINKIIINKTKLGYQLVCPIP